MHSSAFSLSLGRNSLQRKPFLPIEEIDHFPIKIPQRQNITFPKFYWCCGTCISSGACNCTSIRALRSNRWRTYMRAHIIALAAAGLIATPLLAQTPAAPKFLNVAPNDALASNIVGLDVYNAGNENVGEIEDLVFDASKNTKGIVLS